MIPGLRLIVHPSGQKTYALFVRVNGRLVNFRIGSAMVLSLAQARTQARRILTGIAAGEDPARGQARCDPGLPAAVAVVAARFIERHAKVHNKSWRRSERLFAREILPRWGSRPITAIARSDVVALLDAIVDRGRADYGQPCTGSAAQVL